MKLTFNAKRYYNVPAYRIQFAPLSVCFKAFKSADNIIVEIEPNTDKNSISYAQNIGNNIAVVLLTKLSIPNSEEVLAVVPDSENKITTVPRMS